MSDWNLTPSSTAFGSFVEGLAGATELLQILHGHGGALAVVNDQETSEASGLPARSVTPLAPLLTLAVYVVAYANDAPGCSFAVLVGASYVTVAATSALLASRSSKVLPLTVTALSGSLNVAVTAVPGDTAVAPFDGAVAVICGLVVSKP